jgi:2-polyprenyl-3-methyl-5-hydroxy-6-metoxy-1,4-benzoquinol methylase
MPAERRYKLFHEYAHRYDSHTPPGHYKHDHEFVIRKALETAPRNCRLLDVGCGTGVFLEAAIAAGIDGYGIDSAPEMIEVARKRVSAGRARVERMQDISAEAQYDVICALSWTIHYCETLGELTDVIGRCRRALRHGGALILQVANAEQATGDVTIELPDASDGESSESVFVFRFQRAAGVDAAMTAEYVYASRLNSDLVCERHDLRFANPSFVADAMTKCGLETAVINPGSIAPFVVGAVP